MEPCLGRSPKEAPKGVLARFPLLRVRALWGQQWTRLRWLDARNGLRPAITASVCLGVPDRDVALL
jgi:hypothetical protein